jgi:pimeloyl-ACP methyl ester carboxylesterase
MFKDHTFQSDDGLSLHLRDYPARDPKADKHPIVCLPGLSRNARDFHELAVILSQNNDTPRRVVVINYRGRGQSQWDEIKKNYNIVQEAQDVLLAMDELNITCANFIGTSRGGLIVHILAAMKLELLSSVIFNDIGPVIELSGLLEIQKYLENARLPKDWKDAAQIQKSIHGKDFTDLEDAAWAAMAQEIYKDIDGQLMPDFDTAVVDSIKTLEVTTELPTLWEQFDLLKDVPMMAIRGENSSLLSDQTLQAMEIRHNKFTSLTVPNQGHPPILHTAGIDQEITNFLRHQA